MIRQIQLAAYLDGLPGPANFGLATVAGRAPGAGEVQIATLALGMDPFMRLRMRADCAVAPPMRLGAAVEGRGVGRVLHSNDPAFAPGDLVAGDLGWQDEATLPGAGLTRLDPALGSPERYLSALGPSGVSAWFTARMLEVRPGDTVLVAPAAGSVGSLAGQLAAERGGRVVGVGSGAEQLRFLLGDLGFAAAIDAFLDGVGGDLHDAAIAQLAVHARVVLLGFMTHGGGGPAPYGNAAPILFRRATMRGFLRGDFEAEVPVAQAELAARLGDGRLRAFETVWHGLEAAPAAFAALFGDAGPGKQIVKLGE